MSHLKTLKWVLRDEQSNRKQIWDMEILCQVTFMDNSSKRVAKIWRPGHRWRDIKMGCMGFKYKCSNWINVLSKH